jgi:RNA methyltransferase, TrmH family
MAGVVRSAARAGEITAVSSRHNPVVRLYRALVRDRGPDENQPRLLLDGLHLLAEAGAAGLPIESAAFTHQLLDAAEGRALARKLAQAGAQVLAVSPAVMAAMSPVRTPSGAVGIAVGKRASLQAVLERAPQLVVLAIDVQDAGNLGAIARAVEAAGGTGVIACGESADPLGWKALRGSMGSILRLPVARGDFETAVRACRAAGLQLVASAPHGGQRLFEVSLRPPTALLLGSEGRGLPDGVLSRADLRVSIPMQTPVESLNVAVAAAVFLYEACRQRSASNERAGSMP